jgi:Na+/melibiose symporter-like transporter
LLPLLGVAGHGAGVRSMGWFIVVMTPLTVAVAIWRVPEPMIVTPPKRFGLRAYLDLMRRPNVLRLLLADLLIGSGPAITGALFFFFFERVKGFDKGEASLLLLIYFVGGLVGAPLWTWLATRFGKHRTLAASNLLYAVMTLFALAIPQAGMVTAGVLMFLIGVPYAAGAFLLRAMMADVGDEERLQGGVERTGLLYALLSGTVKIGSAASVGIAFPVLQMFGFDPRAGGASEGLDALRLLFVLAPAGLSILAGWVVLNFPLTAERHGEIRRQLAERDLAEAAPEMGAEPRLSEEIHVLTRPAG